MTSSLRILYLASEVVPFSKTGGLADVAGALPEALAGLGCDVRVISPFYAALFHRSHSTVPLNGAAISFTSAGIKQEFRLRAPAQWGGRARQVFVEHPNYYSRRGLYTDPSTGRDYPDNDVRFAFLSRGAIEWLNSGDWIPDIIHCNDWQTALTSAYLKEHDSRTGRLGRVRTLLTVHNMAYQGDFAPERFAFLGFDEGHFTPMSAFEFFGRVNFLKSGLIFADKINTVSPTYAREIQSSHELGAGLEGLLRQRSADVSGILNGIDDHIWNPVNDALIPSVYDSSSLAGKSANKNALCDRSGFSGADRGRPLVGMITRLADQKGLDLVAGAADHIFGLGVNLVLLGTGDPTLHKMFEEWNHRYKGRFHAFLTFDDALAHLIEAGSDMFLMPSRYEPCGLNQMYSLRYGTPPIVRATGGLADTVVDADLHPERGTGFSFDEYTTGAMIEALRRAVAAFHEGERWKAIVTRGMGQDFSWRNSARSYLSLYEAAMQS